jgi:hypothetical protein
VFGIDARPSCAYHLITDPKLYFLLLLVRNGNTELAAPIVGFTLDPQVETQVVVSSIVEFVAPDPRAALYGLDRALPTDSSAFELCSICTVYHAQHQTKASSQFTDANATDLSCLPF